MCILMFIVMLLHHKNINTWFLLLFFSKWRTNICMRVWWLMWSSQFDSFTWFWRSYSWSPWSCDCVGTVRTGGILGCCRFGPRPHTEEEKFICSQHILFQTMLVSVWPCDHIRAWYRDRYDILTMLQMWVTCCVFTETIWRMSHGAHVCHGGQTHLS